MVMVMMKQWISCCSTSATWTNEDFVDTLPSQLRMLSAWGWRWWSSTWGWWSSTSERSATSILVQIQIHRNTKERRQCDLRLGKAHLCCWVDVLPATEHHNSIYIHHQHYFRYLSCKYKFKYRFNANTNTQEIQTLPTFVAKGRLSQLLSITIPYIFIHHHQCH